MALISVNPPGRIAVAEMLTEVNSFSPAFTTRREFEAESLLYGDEIIPFAKKEKSELGGFMKAVDEMGEGQFEIVPIVKARTLPGGPVERSFYEELKRSIVTSIREIENLRGVYLSMHGSMGVEGMFDPEGDLLSAVRAVTGKEMPIGVTFDMHANVTRKKADNATFIVGYKTNPHRDFFRTGYRAGEILVRCIRGEVKPVMAFNKMRLLKGGGMQMDILRPMRRIFSQMKDMEKREGVLSVSNFTVHLWIDDPELGWSTVAVTDGDGDLAQKLADELADLNWGVRAVPHQKGHAPSEAIKVARRHFIRRRTGAVLFSDASDNVLAGAPGENTWILKALREEAPDLVSYLTLRDERAVEEVFGREVGERVTVEVGGKKDRVYNRPHRFTGELIYKEDRSGARAEGVFSEGSGKVAVLRDRGVHLVLADIPASGWSPDFYGRLGLSIWKADIVVVKSIFHFRWKYLLYNRKTVYVETPGTSSTDVHGLRYRHAQRPLYPLDEIPSWRAE